jgi:hypothetical protein
MADVVRYNAKFLSKNECFYSHSRCILSDRMLFAHTYDYDLILTRRVFNYPLLLLSHMVEIKALKAD